MGQVCFLPGVYQISEQQWLHNEDRQEEINLARAEVKYLYRDHSPEVIRDKLEMIYLRARQAITLVKSTY